MDLCLRQLAGADARGRDGRTVVLLGALNARKGHQADDGRGVPTREMDLCLSQLAGAMPVDVMAGASDPANAALPQQPLHPCLLPGAVGFPYFHRRAQQAPAVVPCRLFSTKYLRTLFLPCSVCCARHGSSRARKRLLCTEKS